jgi:hypothetical protein
LTTHAEPVRGKLKEKNLVAQQIKRRSIVYNIVSYLKMFASVLEVAHFELLENGIAVAFVGHSQSHFQDGLEWNLGQWGCLGKFNSTHIGRVSSDYHFLRDLTAGE